MLFKPAVVVPFAGHDRHVISARFVDSHFAYKMLMVKLKAFPYSIPNVGPEADPGVQTVSMHVTVSHPPGGRLPLFSATPVVTFPAAEHYRCLTDAKLHCLVTDAHRCEQLAQGCYAALPE